MHFSLKIGSTCLENDTCVTVGLGGIGAGVGVGGSVGIGMGVGVSIGVGIGMGVGVGIGVGIGGAMGRFPGAGLDEAKDGSAEPAGLEVADVGGFVLGEAGAGEAAFFPFDSTTATALASVSTGFFRRPLSDDITPTMKALRNTTRKNTARKIGPFFSRGAGPQEEGNAAVGGITWGCGIGTGAGMGAAGTVAGIGAAAAVGMDSGIGSDRGTGADRGSGMGTGASKGIGAAAAAGVDTGTAPDAFMGMGADTAEWGGAGGEAAADGNGCGNVGGSGGGSTACQPFDLGFGSVPGVGGMGTAGGIPGEVGADTGRDGRAEGAFVGCTTVAASSLSSFG